MTKPEINARAEDPLRALLAFHGRIRAALTSLDELAETARAASSSRAAGAKVDPMVARALYDFFTGPIVWHDVDEEASLMPRLRRVRHPPRIERLLVRVTEAHLEMEGQIELLLPHLLAVANASETASAEKLEDGAAAMRGILEPHLHMEEQEVMPLARLLLTAEDLQEMSDEMQRRLAERRADLEAG